jgi:hypothetical protein
MANADKKKDEPAGPLYKNPAVVAAALAAIAAIIVAFVPGIIPFLHPQPPAKPIMFRVLVSQSGAIGQNVAAATVKLTLTPTTTQVAPIVRPTDSEGVAVFSLPADVTNTVGIVDVSAANYENFSRNVDITSGSSLAILLRPVQTTPPAPHLEPYTLTKSTGPVPSGPGINKLEYTLESDPPKEGYRIISASYSLAGDRAPCGNYSWCQWRQNDATKAIFWFQLQGHNEWLPPGVSLTSGTLTVTYGPK